MSQTSMLREIDADIFAGFLADGMADSATYTAPGGSASASITVLVDRGAASTGFDSQVIAPQIRITVLRADVDAPIHGGLFTLSTGELFKIDSPTDPGESWTECIVAPYTETP